MAKPSKEVLQRYGLNATTPETKHLVFTVYPVDILLMLKYLRHLTPTSNITICQAIELNLIMINLNAMPLVSRQTSYIS